MQYVGLGFGAGLSSPGPMVAGLKCPARVGRRRNHASFLIDPVVKVWLAALAAQDENLPNFYYWVDKNNFLM